MKSILLVASFIVSTIALAQSPQQMSYQAVVRDSEGILVTDQTIGMQIGILNGSSTGNAVYVENQNVTTNSNGLLTVQIGTGSATNGTFSAIDWGNGTKFIKTEIDPEGGSNYTLTGTSQLASVPYALFAANSGNDNAAVAKLSLLNGVVLIDGATTNKEAFNAGSSTTIDFSKSNLAYTSASPQAITLQGIKDGGTYTLAVQGTAAGLSEFTATGFTFKSKNNNLTTASTETLYSFLVMGSTVYFTMTTGL